MAVPPSTRRSYTRGNAADYDAWEKDWGCHGWNFRTTLPYFKRAEGNQRFVDTWHGADGPLGVSMPLSPLPIADAFIKAAQQYGIPYNPDFNGAKQEGVGFYQVTQKDGKRCSAAHRLSAASDGSVQSGGAHGRTGTRLVIENNRAVGVEIATGGARQIIRAEREVIVTWAPSARPSSCCNPASGLRTS